MWPHQLGLCLLFLIFCLTVSAEPAPDSGFVEAFKRFSDSMFSLDYPYGDSGDMTQCLQREDCGPLYFRAMTSLDKMFAEQRTQLLKNIFWSIDYYCLKDKDSWAENRCVVAIRMLYFFDSIKEDEKIMTFVQQSPVKIKNLMFSRYLVWLKSRPDTSKWQAFVDNEPSIYLENKQHVNAYLIKPGYDYKESFEIVKSQHDYWASHRGKLGSSEK